MVFLRTGFIRRVFFRTDNQHFVLWHTSQRKKIEDDDEMRSDKLVPTVVIFQNCKTCLWVTLLLFRDPFLTSLHKYSPVQLFNCTAVLIWVSGEVFLCKMNRCQFGCQWFTDITQSQRSYSPWYESTMKVKRLLFRSIWWVFLLPSTCLIADSHWISGFDETLRFIYQIHWFFSDSAQSCLVVVKIAAWSCFTCRKEHTADKGGIEITSDPVETGGKVQFAVDRLREPFVVRFHIVNKGTDNVHLTYYTALHRIRCFTLEDKRRVTRASPLFLCPGETLRTSSLPLEMREIN